MAPTAGPDVDPENAPELAGVVHRNIRALIELRREHERARGFQERVAERFTRLAGTVGFVYAQLLMIAGWIAVNLGWLPGVRPFDPFPFGVLGVAASVSCLLLATFVLISQNRMLRLEEKRSELDLQISLLAEHEVTRLIHMVDALSSRLGVPEARHPETEELKREVPPSLLLQEIARAEATGGDGTGS